MLPLGLVLLPGALLAMAGRWVVRAGAVTRLRHVGYAAVALALPYALLAGALAVASRTAVAAPSLLAGGGRVLPAGPGGGRPRRRPRAGPVVTAGHLLAARPRSIVLGMLGAAAMLAAAGAVLAGVSLAVHLTEVRAATDALAPGAGGAALLLLAQLAYAPNAVIWAVAYTLGPGFAFGTGTVVAPTGSVLGAFPASRCSRRCRRGHPAAGLGAGPGAGDALPGRRVRRRRDGPDRADAGDRGGAAVGVRRGRGGGAAGRPGGGVRRRPARRRPPGRGRPVRIRVGLVAMLEIGVTAALAAAAANWLILRRALVARANPGSRRPPRPGEYRAWRSPMARGCGEPGTWASADRRE